MPMTTQWLTDLASYLDQIEETAAELNAAVQTNRSLTRDGAFGSLHEATVGLQEGLSVMERLLERRRTLLDRADAPGPAYSLRDALTLLMRQTADEAVARSMLERCQALSRQIDQIREDALALFVCQFHLADTTSHFLRLLLPNAEVADTYSPHARAHQGGSLLDQAG